jgi:hypothetical protein
MERDNLKNETANSTNTVLADSFQPIPRFAYDGVVEEKGRAINMVNELMAENKELRGEIAKMKQDAKDRKLAENFR